MDPQLSAMLQLAMSTAWALHYPVYEQLSLVLARHRKGEKIDAAQLAEIVRGRDAKTAGPVITDQEWAEKDDDRADQRSKKGYTLVGSVAHIPIGGVMAKHASMVNGMSQPRGTSTERIRGAMDSAIADERVKSVLLHIESPGGSVMGLSALGDDIFSARKTFADRGGEIVTYFDDIGASAAYWIGSQASRVLAGPSAEIGSIGVYTFLADTTEMWRNEGVRLHRVRAGSKKGIGAEGQEVTADDLAVVQGNINDLYDAFKATVMRGRGFDQAKADSLATGEIWIASKALSLGLIDGIASSADEVIAGMNARLSGGGKSGAGKQGGGNHVNTGRASLGQQAQGTSVEQAGQPLNGGALPETAAAAAVNGAQHQGAGVEMKFLNKQFKPDGGEASGGGGSDAGASKPTGVSEAEKAAATAAGVKAENERQAEIRTRGKAFEGNPKMKTLIDESCADTKCTPSMFSEKAMQLLCDEHKPIGSVAAGGMGQGIGGFDLRIGEEARDKKMDAMTLQLVAKYSPATVQKLDDSPSVTSRGGNVVAEAMGFANASEAKKAISMASAANPLGRSRLMDIAAACVATALGIGVTQMHARFPNEAAFMAAVTSTGDFPALMSRYINKTLLPAFMECPVMWDQVCAVDSTTDFKDADLIGFSEAADMQLVLNGERARKSNFKERKEVFPAVDTYRQEFGIDYKALRNDDLGAFNRITAAYIQACRRLPDQLLAIMLARNSGDGPTLADGTALFATARGNKAGSGTTISQANLIADYNAAAKRTGFGTNSAILEVMPDRVLVPFANGLAMDEVLKSQYKPGGANNEVNVIQGKWKVLPWMRLTGTRRYYFSSPTAYPVFIMKFLDGQQTPQITRIENGNVLRTEWDICMPGVGIGCTGQHEGCYTNPGT